MAARLIATRLGNPPTLMPAAKPPTLDIFIVHTPMEWQVAAKVGQGLANRGYSISATQPIEYPGYRHDVTASDARATIVIWPLNHEMCDMLEMEARAAAQRGRLVQIYASDVRPSESYFGPEPVDFTGWDYTKPGPRWRTLLQRLKPLCGPPPRRPIDARELSRMGAMGAIGLAAAAGYVYLNDQKAPHLETATPLEPQLSEPQAEPIRTVEDVRRAPDRADGGEYLLPPPDDQGVDIEKLRVTPTEDKPEPAPRAPQGPEL